MQSCCFVLTTTNKRALDQLVGETEALEIIGNRTISTAWSRLFVPHLASRVAAARDVSGTEQLRFDSLAPRPQTAQQFQPVID